MSIPFVSKHPGRSRALLLLITDVLALSFAIFIGFFLYKQQGARYTMEIVWHLWPIPLMVVAMNLAGRVYLGNLLYPGLPMNPVEELRRQTMSIIAAFAFFSAFLTFTRTNLLYSRTAITYACILSLFVLPLFRVILRCIISRLHLCRIPTIIMGDTVAIKKIIKKINTDSTSILEIVGTVTESEIWPYKNYTAEELKVLSARERSYLIFCPGVSYPLSYLQKFMFKFHRVLIVEEENSFPVLRMYAANFYNFLAFETGNCLRRKAAILEKRIFEFLFSLVAFIVAIIPMIILAICVKVTSRGPIFYAAERLGRRGKPIRVFKFRTMYSNAERRLDRLLKRNPKYRAEWQKKFKLDKDPRITPIGRFLRKTSLDELPQLLNVIKGEMSLIGPRPIVQAEVKYYGEYYDTFASVKPGITGLWQVSGRSNLDYDERVALDIYYINNWSIWLDYYIFFATIREVIFNRGAK